MSDEIANKFDFIRKDRPITFLKKTRNKAAEKWEWCFSELKYRPMSVIEHMTTLFINKLCFLSVE